LVGVLEKRRTIPQTPRKPSVRSRVLCGISSLLRRSDRGRAERATCSRPFIPPGPLCSRDGTRSRLMPHSSPDSARRSRLRRSRDRWRFAPPCPRRITLPFATARPGAERSRSDRVCSNGEAVRARFIARPGEGQGCGAVPGGLKGRGGPREPGRSKHRSEVVRKARSAFRDDERAKLSRTTRSAGGPRDSRERSERELERRAKRVFRCRSPPRAFWVLLSSIAFLPAVQSRTHRSVHIHADQ